MAVAAGAPPGPRRLRGDEALTDRPFEVEPERLYEVGRGGRVFTERPEDPRHAARLRWLLAAGIALNALTWPLAALALVLGGPSWGAGFGLAALLSLPVLGVPVAMEGWARLRARRRHRVRPPGFGPG